MKWFGESWGAPVCEEANRIETPVGEDCGYCDDPIKAGDIGLRMPFMSDPTGRGYMSRRIEPSTARVSQTSGGYMNTHHGCFMRAVIPPDMLEGAK